MRGAGGSSADLNNVDIAQADFPAGFDPANPLTYSN